MNTRDLIARKHERLRELFPEFPPYSSVSYEITSSISQRDPQIWGSNCWFAYPDFAYSSIKEMKSQFTEIAEAEFAAGVRNFYVELPAHDKAEIAGWFELGFGLQHVSGILREFNEVTLSDEYVVRRPEIIDLPAIAQLERELSIHQQRSPVFSTINPDPVEEIMQEWQKDITDTGLSSFVVEFQGHVIALAYGCSTERSRMHSGLLRPENSATLAFAAVAPEFRGRQVGRAVASRVIRDLYDRGFTTIVTDWRATNQLSSHTWPRLGFMPTIYRLHRAL